MPNSHGTKKAYELDKCKCDICVEAQRLRWAAKDERRRNRKNDPNPERPVIGKRPALRVVRQEETAPAKPEPAAAASIPNAVPAAIPPRAPKSIEMPRLWPIHDTEPEYAEEHREYLAGIILYILKDPARNVSNVEFSSDSTKQETKDFERLLGVFQRNNPDLIEFNHVAESYRGLPYFGAYYEFQIYSPDYEFEDESGDASEAAAEPAVERATGTAPPPVSLMPAWPLAGAPGRSADRERQAAAEPAQPAARRARAYSGPAQPRDVPMGNAPSVPGRAVRQSDSRLPRYELRPNPYGMCEAKLYADESHCSHAVGAEDEWTYRVNRRPVCQDHYNAIRVVHPGRCEYKRNGQWMPAPIN